VIFIGSMMVPPEVGVVPLFIAMLQVGWASTLPGPHPADRRQRA